MVIFNQIMDQSLQHARLDWEWAFWLGWMGAGYEDDR
jgi:hypothetical protein